MRVETRARCQAPPSSFAVKTSSFLQPGFLHFRRLSFVNLDTFALWQAVHGDERGQHRRHGQGALHRTGHSRQPHGYGRGVLEPRRATGVHVVTAGIAGYFFCLVARLRQRSSKYVRWSCKCTGWRAAIEAAISRLLTGHDPARGSGQEVYLKPADRVGSGQKVLEFSRIESGRIRRFSNITGRAGPGHPDTIRPARSDLCPVKSAGIFQFLAFLFLYDEAP